MKITKRQLRRIISEALGENLLPGFYRNNVQQSGRGSEGDLEVDFFALYQALENAGVKILEYGDFAGWAGSGDQVGAFVFYVEENDNLNSIITNLNREWAPIRWSVGDPQKYMQRNLISVYADFKDFNEPVYDYGR
jgi:hypothetical protein